MDLWTESGQSSETVLFTFDSSLFQLEENVLWTAPGVTANLEQLSQNPETGICELLLTINHSENESANELLTFLIENHDQSETAQLSARIFLTPVSDNGVTSGTERSLTLQINGQPLVEKIVSVQFDLNDNGSVDIQDLVRFARVFGQNTEENPQSSHSDFNGDSRIDISDLVLFARHFGEKAPINPSFASTDTQLLSSAGTSTLSASSTSEELSVLSFSTESIPAEVSASEKQTVFLEATSLSPASAAPKSNTQEFPPYREIPFISKHDHLLSSFPDSPKSTAVNTNFSEIEISETDWETILTSEYSREKEFQILDEIFEKDQKFPLENGMWGLKNFSGRVK